MAQKGDYTPDRSRADARELTAEALGTAFLVATVIGSGIMGERLSGGNEALALLANALATGAILVVLIAVFAPVSGAHFNPAVTLAFLLRKETTAAKAAAFMAAQIAAGIAGAVLAHLMFGLDPVQLGTHARWGAGQWLGEAVATFALVFTILACARQRPEIVPYAVGLVITAGYWYTSSTSFANPAVTIARTFTDTFTAIRPVDAVPFVAVQLLTGAGCAALARWMFAGTAKGRG